MIAYGIDLSAAKVAVAQVNGGFRVRHVEAGPVKGEDHEARIARAAQLAGTVKELLAGVDAEDVIAIESPSVAGRGQGHATGEVFGLVLRVVISEAAGQWFLVNPMHLKMFATGKGRAEKDEIRLAVFKRWGFEAETNDEIDAFVLAQMARCTVEPDCYTAQQREVVGRCFLTGGKKPRRKNLQFDRATL